MAARAELVARGDPHQWWLDYIRSERLDVPTVARFAGMIAVTACVFYDHGRSISCLPKEREAEPAAVIQVLGYRCRHAHRPGGLAAGTRRIASASLFGDVLLLGIDRVGNAATYFAGQPLQLFKTPLAWLQAGCRGAVIVRSAWRAGWCCGARSAASPARIFTMREPSRS